MKLHIRLTAMGLVLILLLGTLSSCGKPGAEHTAPPEETPSVSVTPTSTPEPVLTSTPEPEPSPEPVEPNYDPLTDPNVYWGTELDRCPVYGYLSGFIWKGELLENLLLQADDDQLIAFHIFGSTFFSGINDLHYPDIKLDDMNIPEELNPDGTLTNLVLEYIHAESQAVRSELYSQMELHVWNIYNEWIERLDLEEARIIDELLLEILKERGVDPDTAAQGEKQNVKMEARQRIKYDERHQEYRNERDATETFIVVQREFFLQFEAFFVEDMRQVMIERGFIPVYKSLTENPVPERTEGRFYGTFIGTASQIKDAENLIKDFEAYIFDLAVKP